MEQKDYYEILGVNRDASQDEIQKAFRKKSMEYHPDRHINDSEEDKKIAEEKFKEINEANSVLSDPKKRSNYDNFGTEDDFVDPFEGFDPFAGFRKKSNKGEDIVAEVIIDEKEAFVGVKKNVEIKREKQCTHCNGTGSADGKDTACPHCHGTGRIKNVQKNGFMTMVQESYCPHCHGTGKIITNPCTHCGGTGIEYDIETIPFDIPAGIFDGATIVGEGLGNASKSGGINGDLYIKVRILSCGDFKRHNNDVITTIKLNLEEAWCGCEKTVYNVDGSSIKIKIPELSPCRKEIVSYGKGYADPRTGQKGNFIAIVDYEIPKKLSKEQKELLKKFYELGK